jgi:hypothetical protein
MCEEYSGQPKVVSSGFPVVGDSLEFLHSLSST